MALGDVIAGPFALGYLNPQGLAYASDNTLFNVDENSDEVKHISVTATPISSWAFTGNLTDLSYDASDDTLWAIESLANQYRHYSLTGTVLSTFSNAEISFPEGITTLPENTAILRIYDAVDETIWRVTKTGTFQGTAIGDVTNVNVKMIAYQKDAVAPNFRGVYFISYFSPGTIDNITGQFANPPINFTINTSVNQSGIAWDGANLWSVNSQTQNLELLEIDGLLASLIPNQGYITLLF